MLSLDPILNLFIGLALTFGSFSLLTGTIVEALASARNWRSKTPVTGIGQMLNDTTLQGVAAKVLEHPAVNPLLAVAPDGQLNAKRPAYIEPAQFAAALVDVLKIPEQIEDGADRLEAALMHVEDPQLRRFLAGLLTRAKGDMAQFRSGIAAWFDSAMDRVSGGYKRNVQLWNFLVALLLAAGMKVNALAVAQQLWVQPGLSASLMESVRATTSPRRQPWPRCRASRKPIRSSRTTRRCTASGPGACLWAAPMSRCRRVHGTGRRQSRCSWPAG
jgi:hypothetical protein